MTDTRHHQLDFDRWLRTGRWVPAQLADPRLEVKFNPNHDPANGRFTSGPGGGGPAEDGASANMARRPHVPKRSQAGVTWGGGGFTGGGGGSGGGGGASGDGYWMNDREVRAFRERHPGREPHMVRPGETIDRIAADHGISPSRLKAINDLAPGATARAGQVLALPNNKATLRAPDASAIHKNGYTFRHDLISRTTHVSGSLALTATPVRSATNQREAGGADRRRDDDGGHFIAARFNGPTDKFNHFAQNRNFNRGSYRVMEDAWARDLRGGKRVSVAISVSYIGSSNRPDSIKAIWTVNGRPYRHSFNNRRQESSRGR